MLFGWTARSGAFTVTARRHLRRLIVLIVVLVVGLTALGSVALLLLFREVAAVDTQPR